MDSGVSPQAHRKNGFKILRARLDIAAMRFGDLAGNVQTEPEAAIRAMFRRRIALLQGHEQLLQDMRLDRSACIPDLEGGQTLLAHNRHDDERRRLALLDGVNHQIAQQSLQA